jgi:hypothetical protein
VTRSAALDLAAEVADAHAGTTLAAADHVTVSFSSGGLAFTAKRQPHALARVEARLNPLRQRLSLAGDTPRPWRVDFGDSEELRLRLVELRSSSRRLRWGPEDLGAFAAAAIWTYVTMSLLLDRAEHLHRLPDAGDARRLRVTLPATLAGHGRVHTLYIGPDSLISRHDYTATAFGTWARASQHITSYETFDGVPIGTSRVVRPRLGRPLPAPTLVWIEIHSMQVGLRT